MRLSLLALLLPRRRTLTTVSVVVLVSKIVNLIAVDSPCSRRRFRSSVEGTGAELDCVADVIRCRNGSTRVAGGDVLV